MSLVLVLALVVALGAGLARGGSLRSLAETRFRWFILLFEGLAIQVVFDIWDPAGLDRGDALAVLLLSNAAVGGFILLNLRVPGMLLAGLGLALNVIVISANQAMPVSAHAARNAGIDPLGETTLLKHERLNSDTRFRWLADVIPVPGLKEILSVGDLVLALGVARLVYARTAAGNRTKGDESSG